MKFAIYGVSRSGKDYLIGKLSDYFSVKGVSLCHINGSETLRKLADNEYGKPFKYLTEDEKNILRKKFIEILDNEEANYTNIVIDGHYSFYNDKNEFFTVFTKYDLNCYDKFIYLDTTPSDVVERMRNSEGDKKNTSMTEQMVAEWQNFEIDRMTLDLLKVQKELHIVRYDNEFTLEYIYDVVTSNKYDSKLIAKKLLQGVPSLDNFNTVILTDCDKTISIEDTTNIALDYLGKSKKPLKTIFAGDRYSNYQMQLADKYYKEVGAFTAETFDEVCRNIHLNQTLIDDLNNKSEALIISITAGNSDIWTRIIKESGLNATVLHNCGTISKYVKYFVTKELKNMGKFVIAIGDSMLDSLMISTSNIGYLATTKGYRRNIEDFLRQNSHIRQLEYFDFKYKNVTVDDKITSIKTLTPTEEIESYISICKSESGVAGKDLRNAHSNLGSKIGKLIRSDFINEKLTVIIMMRSGLSFGMGIADYLDCPVLFYDDKNPSCFIQQLEDNPNLKGSKYIICDGVVNTGASILALYNSLREYSPIIATNVLSEKYDANRLVPIYSSRVSKNSYKGAKQSTIKNGKGPDTSDRLFNLL